jgi:hypothetical protein
VSRIWFWLQIAVALAVIAAGVVGYQLADWAAYLSTVGYGTVLVNAWFFFPGLALSLVVNAFVMRAHGPAGLSGTEKVLLVFEVIFIAALVASQFWVTSILSPALVLWPLLFVWAIVVVIVAGVRNSTLRRVAAQRDVDAAFPGA